MRSPVPVVLFAYARPRHLERVLTCLRENGVPLIEAYADGAKNDADVEAVAAVRTMLRAVDWCDLRLTERPANFGLGRNVLTGVNDVISRHDSFIVWEDDLICASGTYAWMTAALRTYAQDPRVMSVAAWTHPRVTPKNVENRPYFDGRAECWGWGSWSRAWRGMMEETAWTKLLAIEASGIFRGVYGADFPEMARVEERRNIWAVRWGYHHLQHGGLCLRPPWTMVEHIGFDVGATNAGGDLDWANQPLQPAPPIPVSWPAPQLHPDCALLWRRAAPSRWVRRWRRWFRFVVGSNGPSHT